MRFEMALGMALPATILSRLAATGWKTTSGRQPPVKWPSDFTGQARRAVRLFNTLLIVEPPEGAPICAAPGNVKPPAAAERSAVLAETPVLE
jgi:hypothetical protein